MHEGKNANTVELPVITDKRPLTEAEKAWMAAAVDGEGSVFLSKRNDLRRRPSGAVFVFNTNRDFIDKAADIMGQAVGRRPRVYIHNNKRIGLNQKPCFGTYLRGTSCKDLLAQILPYLIIKKDRAGLILGADTKTVSEHLAHLNREIWPALIGSGEFTRRGHA